MTRTIALLALLAALTPAAANDLAKDLAPTGTLRVTFIGRNPVQATIDEKTGEARGPAAEIARMIAGKLGVPLAISGVANGPAVIESVKSGVADIGFVAFDPIRAAEVDFAQAYSLVQNSYAVLEGSSIRVSADVDKPGIRVGVGERDAGDFFLTRTLKHAELKRNSAGSSDAAIRMLTSGEVDVYGGNRQRMSEVVARTPGLRLLADSFYAVEQAIIVPKGNAARLAIVNRMIDEARASGLTAAAIARAGLVGVDVAPGGASRQ
jgi:polar amino acid transport system substrate-binding protein